LGKDDRSIRLDKCLKIQSRYGPGSDTDHVTDVQSVSPCSRLAAQSEDEFQTIIDAQIVLGDMPLPSRADIFALRKHFPREWFR